MRNLFRSLCCLLMMTASFHGLCQTIIKLKKQGNVFILPCKVNGLQMSLFFDTGADDVSLSLKEARYMLKNGYLAESDIVGKQSYTTANGDIAEGTKIIIRKITFAGLEITDVAASVMPNEDAPLLFGQSAIGKLGKIQIDPSDNTITIFKGKGHYDFSKDEYADKDAVAVEAPNTKETNRYTPSNNNTAGIVNLQHAMKLPIDRQGGANGASVAWHPVQKKYYAAMAGNTSFPLEVFDASGRMVSTDDLQAMFDVRGLWYNSNTQTLQANGYNDLGWMEYVLGPGGIPVAAKRMDINTSQPSIQSVGAYDGKNNVVYFYDMEHTSIETHRAKDGAVYKPILLYLGVTDMGAANAADRDEAKYNYNENVIVYTGIPRAEIGLLNVRDRQVELYDVNTGLMTKTCRLPSDAPIQSSLNFSYCNAIYWLFDKDARVWQGYK